MDWIQRWFGPGQPQRPQTELPVHETIRVLMIGHNPPVPAAGGRRLTELVGWHDPDTLARQYCADLREASHGYARYQIIERIDADWYPPKIDGFRYTNDTFLAAWNSRTLYQPNAIDYPAQVREFRLIERYERGDFDEVWFFSFPYAGDYESTMVGRGAFWCNSPPVAATQHCQGRFVIMAFNYERGVDCMLENYGHRVESMMSRLYARHAHTENMWERFTRHDLTHPGGAQCGNVHFAPNSIRDYDWGNQRPVWSACDDWFNYPNLTGAGRTVTCRDWGNGDMRAHHLWWLERLPHHPGTHGGIQNNWWYYLVDANRVP